MEADSDAMFRDDLDSFLQRLSSLLGAKVRQKLADWKTLIHLIITPGTIINILHPLVIFLSATLLPHCFSFWIQIPLYLAFLHIASKWCHFVAKLKVQRRKQGDRSNTILPTLVMCTEEGEEKNGKIHFFHLKNPALSEGQKNEDVQDNDSNDEETPKKPKNCKPFLVLGDLPDGEV